MIWYRKIAYKISNSTCKQIQNSLDHDIKEGFLCYFFVSGSEICFSQLDFTMVFVAYFIIDQS